MSRQSLLLIVDDDVVLAELTCEIVELAGVRAVYRTNVIDAVDFLARNAGSVVGVLTDIHLATPMSGLDLAMHIHQEWPAVALCVVSGVSTQRPARMPPGATFISKPWQSADLLAFVAAAKRI